ncbi:MAG: hypothetical protein ABII74_09405 [Elusimicrobiota bacterium]
MRIGVHCSIRNGLEKALEEAQALQCQTLQIFARNPRGWRQKKKTVEEVESFNFYRKNESITYR